MKNDLFKRYCPRWFHQLKTGDSVWAVNYGDWPGIQRYVVTNIKKEDNFIMFDIERDINSDVEVGFIGMYKTWFYIDSDKPECSARTSSFYHKRIFSDETVAKHSLSQHIKRLKKKLKGKLDKVQRFINHAEKVENYMGAKLLKQEKTCCCISELTIANDNINRKDDSVLTFREKREYQVDVFSTTERSTYKVYQNGGWDDFVRLNEDEFKQHFELIK